ncbi:MAG: aldolase/citrate lyase family protein [Rhodospirillaceae bacterium]|nr:aldolase/citrate lyase family protein [Rhodospirillaceae bacterium]
MIRTNPVKARLAAGKKCLGVWLVANDPISAEIIGQVGYDFVIIDHEHGPGEFVGAAGQMQALRSGSIGALNDDGRDAGGPATFIRVPWNDAPTIKRALDIGAEGIMVPYVETAEEAQEAVHACKFPPEGCRGCAIGVIRGSGYGQNAADYWDRINDEVCVMVQIETQKGIESIPQIAKIDGVDIIFIGPNDMTVTSGFNPLKPTHEARAIIKRAEAAIETAGKPMGAVPYYGQTVPEMFDRGYDLIAAGSELSLLRTAGKAAMDMHRSAHG